MYVISKTCSSWLSSLRRRVLSWMRAPRGGVRMNEPLLPTFARFLKVIVVIRLTYVILKCHTLWIGYRMSYHYWYPASQSLRSIPSVLRLPHVTSIWNVQDCSSCSFVRVSSPHGRTRNTTADYVPVGIRYLAYITSEPVGLFPGFPTGV